MKSKRTRWALCGKCRKHHIEGSKIQIKHAKEGHMGKGRITWTETDPATSYGSRR